MSVNFFLGFRLGVHPDWRDRVGPVVAPGNYKKAESIQKYIDEKWKELEENAAAAILGGVVERIIVLGLNGKDPETLKAEEFLDKMQGIKTSQYPIRLFAFDISDRMMQLMLTIFDRGGKEFPHWLLSSYEDAGVAQSQLIDPWRASWDGRLPRDKFLKYAPISEAAKAASGPGDTDTLALEGAKLVRETAEILSWV